MAEIATAVVAAIALVFGLVLGVALGYAVSKGRRGTQSLFEVGVLAHGACPRCHGRGRFVAREGAANPPPPMDCPDCYGTGWRPALLPQTRKLEFEKSEPCERCRGCGAIANTQRGEAWADWVESDIPHAEVTFGFVRPVECPDCGGTGYKRVGPPPLDPRPDLQLEVRG